MSNKNKKTVVTMEDAKKVENQEQTVAPEVPDDKGEPTDKKEDGNEETDGEKEKKFHLPKIVIPKIPLPSKTTVLNALKNFALLLIGAITGAVAITAAAIKVANAEKAEAVEEEDTNEESEPEEVEDEPDEAEEPETAD